MKRRLRWLAALVVALLLGIPIERLRYDLRSYSARMHFLDPKASGPLLRWETYDVTTEEVQIATQQGPVEGRLYLPAGVSQPQGIVIVHGIHHLGIDEPRLMSLSRAMAGSGFAVLTPLIAALADYHVDGESTAMIGESPRWLGRRLGKGPVTLVGINRTEFVYHGE